MVVHVRYLLKEILQNMANQTSMGVRDAIAGLYEKGWKKRQMLDFGKRPKFRAELDDSKER